MKYILFWLLFIKLLVSANTNLQVLVIELKKDITNITNIALFINSDGDKDTGYSKNGILGADILIQNDVVFERISNSNSNLWDNWKKIGVSELQKYENKISFKLSKNDKKNLFISKNAKLQAFKYSDDYKKAVKVDIAGVVFQNAEVIKKDKASNNGELIKLKKSSDGIIISSIKIANQNIIKSGSKIFSLKVRTLLDGKDTIIDSLSGWGDIEFKNSGLQKVIIFSKPKNKILPQSLKITADINLKGSKSTWDISVKGVGSKHSIVDIDMPKLRFKKLTYGKFLIPKYTGKIIDVENEEINRDMLYPCGWTSTMQFLAYYNHVGGVYLGNHDPKASTKRFIVKKTDNTIEYSTKIIPPNKTLANNNFKLSGVFELDSFEGDWYDASLIYKNWASKNADYWPKMTPSRIERQHNLGEIALWMDSVYISAIEDSNRDRNSKDRHIKNYIDNIKHIIDEEAVVPFPDVGIGFVWHEWYGKIQDTNFPSVFFPKKAHSLSIKNMIQEVRQKYPKLQIMPYINGLLYNKHLDSFNNKYSAYALKNKDGNFFNYLARGEIDRKYKERQFVRMDPTGKPWQTIIAKAAQVVTNDIDADGVYVDQVTASCPKEDMDIKHNHPISGGHWWRDGYAGMFEKIDQKINKGKYVTSEGANEFLSDHVDGFFVNWDGVNDMVPAYQVVYGGKVQLFGLSMRTNTYNRDSFYMQYAQAFSNAMGIGMITSWLTKDQRVGASVAFSYVKNLAFMRYRLREFLSYGQMKRNIILRGNIPKLSDYIKDYRAMEEPNMIDGKLPITMSAIQHSVYISESKGKVAFIFANASRSNSVSFSFDIDGSLYGFNGNLKIKKVTPDNEGKRKKISNNIVKDITIKPLGIVAFIISN